LVKGQFSEVKHRPQLPLGYASVDDMLDERNSRSVVVPNFDNAQTHLVGSRADIILSPPIPEPGSVLLLLSRLLVLAAARRCRC
jgi:hypothetical protein